jgi:hypothetical protein
MLRELKDEIRTIVRNENKSEQMTENNILSGLSAALNVLKNIQSEKETVGLNIGEITLLLENVFRNFTERQSEQMAANGEIMDISSQLSVASKNINKSLRMMSDVASQMEQIESNSETENQVSQLETRTQIFSKRIVNNVNYLNVNAVFPNAQDTAMAIANEDSLQAAAAVASSAIATLSSETNELSGHEGPLDRPNQVIVNDIVILKNIIFEIMNSPLWNDKRRENPILGFLLLMYNENIDDVTSILNRQIELAQSAMNLNAINYEHHTEVQLEISALSEASKMVELSVANPEMALEVRKLIEQIVVAFKQFDIKHSALDALFKSYAAITAIDVDDIDFDRNCTSLQCSPINSEIENPIQNETDLTWDDYDLDRSAAGQFAIGDCLEIPPEVDSQYLNGADLNEVSLITTPGSTSLQPDFQNDMLEDIFPLSRTSEVTVRSDDDVLPDYDDVFPNSDNVNYRNDWVTNQEAGNDPVVDDEYDLLTAPQNDNTLLDAEIDNNTRRVAKTNDRGRRPATVALRTSPRKLKQLNYAGMMSGSQNSPKRKMQWKQRSSNQRNENKNNKAENSAVVALRTSPRNLKQMNYAGMMSGSQNSPKRKMQWKQRSSNQRDENENNEGKNRAVVALRTSPRKLKQLNYAGMMSGSRTSAKSKNTIQWKQSSKQRNENTNNEEENEAVVALRTSPRKLKQMNYAGMESSESRKLSRTKQKNWTIKPYSRQESQDSRKNKMQRLSSDISTQVDGNKNDESEENAIVALRTSPRKRKQFNDDGMESSKSQKISRTKRRSVLSALRTLRRVREQEIRNEQTQNGTFETRGNSGETAQEERDMKSNPDEIMNPEQSIEGSSNEMNVIENPRPLPVDQNISQIFSNQSEDVAENELGVLGSWNNEENDIAEDEVVGLLAQDAVLENDAMIRRGIVEPRVYDQNLFPLQETPDPSEFGDDADGNQYGDFNICETPPESENEFVDDEELFEMSSDVNVDIAESLLSSEEDLSNHEMEEMRVNENFNLENPIFHSLNFENERKSSIPETFVEIERFHENGNGSAESSPFLRYVEDAKTSSRDETTTPVFQSTESTIGTLSDVNGSDDSLTDFSDTDTNNVSSDFSGIDANRLTNDFSDIESGDFVLFPSSSTSKSLHNCSSSADTKFLWKSGTRVIPSLFFNEKPIAPFKHESVPIPYHEYMHESVPIPYHEYMHDTFKKNERIHRASDFEKKTLII